MASPAIDRELPAPQLPWQWVFDIFDDEGRFLGNVDYPPLALRETVIRGNHLIANVEDDAGTFLVKRYRLESPDEP